MSTITYDSQGLCTRCGSTGYYLSSYISDSSFVDERACIAPCPCHGWRPVQWAPRNADDWVDLCGPNLTPTESFWSPEGRHTAAGTLIGDALVTHYRPRPLPPEGV